MMEGECGMAPTAWGEERISKPEGWEWRRGKASVCVGRGGGAGGPGQVERSGSGVLCVCVCVCACLDSDGSARKSGSAKVRMTIFEESSRLDIGTASPGMLRLFRPWRRRARLAGVKGCILLPPGVEVRQIRGMRAVSQWCVFFVVARSSWGVAWRWCISACSTGGDVRMLQSPSMLVTGVVVI